MPAGRPSLFTEPNKKRILKAIRCGNYREVAVKCAGIAQRTFSDWLARGKKEQEGEYYEFSLAVLKAENLAEIEAVNAIRAAGKDDPKHYQWWLERKGPERWGRNRIEVEILQKQVDRLTQIVENLLADQKHQETGTTDTANQTKTETVNA